jgi:FPC/CPF motif-containing protein YcgG
VLCENVKSLTLTHNHSLVTKMCAKKKSAATANFLELSWRVLRNFDLFFVDDVVSSGMVVNKFQIAYFEFMFTSSGFLVVCKIHVMCHCRMI